MAQRGRLYPSCILYGASLEERKHASVELARTLLCTREPEERPCPEGSPAACTHCRRLEWPGKEAEHFHPDFHVLERDLRTTTSVDATRTFLNAAYSSPFEARGQVFVIAEAETLSPGGADALLKLLEEPPIRTPRNFMLLAPSRLDLLVTLRSRSLAVYLGKADSLDEEEVARVAEGLATSIDSLLREPSPLYLITAAQAFAQADGWQDPRARRPWATAAAATVRVLGEPAATFDSPMRRALLELAEALLDGPRMRRRGIGHERILEGLVARHLAVHANPMASG